MFTLKVCVGFVNITLKIWEWPGDEASKPTVVASYIGIFSRVNLKILVFGKPKSQKRVHAINTDMNGKIYRWCSSTCTVQLLSA